VSGGGHAGQGDLLRETIDGSVGEWVTSSD